MNIIVGNVHALTPPGPIRTKARDILKYRRKGYQFVEAFRARNWDGWTRMVSQTGHFPAGLTYPLIAELAEAGYAVGVDDQRTKPAPHPSISAARVLLPLDSHQQEAVEAAHATTRGVVEFPTGVGKARILAATVARLRLRRSMTKWNSRSTQWTTIWPPRS